MTTKERVIQYLLSKERTYNDNKLYVSVSRKSFSESEISDIGESVFIHHLSLLETDGLITVTFRTGHRDLSYRVVIVLHSSIINYFEDKKMASINRRNNWIQFWIPVCLSAVALAVSIIALLLELKVIQPMQQPKIEVGTTDVVQPSDSLDQ